MNYKDNDNMLKNAFIILAAGSSSRFNNRIAKQFVKIGDYNSIQHILNEITLNTIALVLIVWNTIALKVIAA